MTTLIFITLVATLSEPATDAQQKPNLTGTWVVVSPESSAGQGERLKHQGMTLVRGHDSEGGHGHTFSYKLDGSESRNVLSPHPGEEIVVLARAAWEGDTLVIREAAMYPNGRTREVTSRWRVDEKGRLHIEAAITVDGKSQPGMTTIYRRKEPGRP